jgi:outer membrane receptor protein involved in Fe transport
MKWQITDTFAIRGSIGTTFRAPTASDLDPTVGTVLTPIIAAGSTSKPVESSGNPNLAPEKAKSGNVGVLFEKGGIRFSVDYWRFDFSDPIVRTDVNAAASSVVPVALGLANCAAPLRYLIFFDNNNACVQGVTTGANIERARRDLINGSPIQVEGVDFDASVRFDVGPGELVLSGSGTWMLKYDVGPTVFEGVFMAAGYDALGWLNETRVTGALPKFKAYGRADYSFGNQSLGAGVRFLSSFLDDRNIFTAASPLGKKIDEQTLIDVTYVLRLETWTLSATVNNLFDSDPAFVRAVPGYDTFTGDPLGRVFKLGVRKRF